jgi:Ca2+-binding RTX toxin-like protein
LLGHSGEAAADLSGALWDDRDDTNRLGGDLRLAFLVIAGSTIALAQAMPTGAATASVGPGNSVDEVRVHYVADPGEANNVSIHLAASPVAPGFDIEITDSGTTITAGSGCTAITPSKVQCNASSGDRINAKLGDRPDFLSISHFLDCSNRVGGGSGDDTIRGADSAGSLEGLHGGPGDDVLLGRDVMLGGYQSFKGGAGSDRIDGKAGRDSIVGSRGPDRLTGGAGRDTIFGGSGNDTLFSRDGLRERVYGEAGHDRARVDGRDLLSGVEELF